MIQWFYRYLLFLVPILFLFFFDEKRKRTCTPRKRKDTTTAVGAEFVSLIDKTSFCLYFLDCHEAKPLAMTCFSGLPRATSCLQFSLSVFIYKFFARFPRNDIRKNTSSRGADLRNYIKTIKKGRFLSPLFLFLLPT